MSYILDALRRADAERQSGKVPGLHTRQVTTPASQGATGARKRLWPAAAAALALVAVAAGLWLWRAPADDQRPAAAEVALVQPAPTPTPTPASEPSPQPAVPPVRAVVPSPSAARPAESAPVAKPALPTPAAQTQVPPKRKPDAAPKAAVQAASAPAAQTPLPAAKAPASRAAPADAPLLSELPEDIRRQIPPLSINGVVYSQNPKLRMLVVNQQVLTQGSQAAPDVNLEEIQPRSSVFSFRGTRFRVAH